MEEELVVQQMAVIPGIRAVMVTQVVVAIQGVADAAAVVEIK